MSKDKKTITFDTCGAKTRGGTPCQRPAGWGTIHAGEGKCKLHGGASPGAPIKHGKNAKLTSRTLRDKIQLHLQDPDPLDLTGELALLRSLLDHFQEKLDRAEELEASGILPVGMEDDGTAAKDPMENWNTLTLIVDNIRKVADTISKIQCRELLTAAEMTLAIVVLAEVLREEVEDGKILQRIFNKYSQRLKVPRLSASSATLLDTK